MYLDHRLSVLLQLHIDLTPGFNGLGKDNCKTRRETFKFWDLVNFISDGTFGLTVHVVDGAYIQQFWGQCINSVFSDNLEVLSLLRMTVGKATLWYWDL